MKDSIPLPIPPTNKSYEYVEVRYGVGDVTLLELLDAERSLSQARQVYAAAHTDAAVHLVMFFKALGGGWNMASAAVTK